MTDTKICYYDRVQKSYEADAVLGINLEEILRNVPLLQSKYFKTLGKLRRLYDEEIAVSSDKEVNAYLYYSGQAEPKRYLERPLLKTYTEHAAKVMAKRQCVDQNAKLRDIVAAQDLCESILKSLKDRPFMVRTMLEWQRFKMQRYDQ